MEFLDQLLGMLRVNEDPMINMNISYLFRYLLKMGGEINGAEKLLQKMFSSEFSKTLISKLNTEDSNLAESCCDILKAQFQFLEENQVFITPDFAHP